MKKLNCKVLIVGGGPGGATAARELNKFKIDNILLEKNFNFAKPCGGGLIKKAFKEFDIDTSLIDKEITSIKVVSPTKKSASVDILDSPLAIINRAKFDSHLRELAKRDGSKLIEAKAYHLKTDKNKTVIYAKNKNDTFAIECQYLIVADGVNSTIRKLLYKKDTKKVLTYYANIKNLNTNECQFWFSDNFAPKNYAWIFPHYNGINIGVASNNTKDIKRYFNNFLKSANIKTSIKPKGYYIPIWGKPLFCKDNILFVGDSGSFVLPFTYEGIYYAMQSAKFAAIAIAQNNPLAYEQMWKKQNLKRFKFLALLQKIFLYNSSMSEKLVKLYTNKKFQKSVIAYWIGAKKPEGFFKTLYKVFKALVRF